jgi:hypothetical protein
MILDGLALATLTTGGLYLIYKALPPSICSFLERHQLLTRASCALMTYALFGGTLTALFAAAWLDLIVGTLMALSKDPKTSAMMSRLAAYINMLREQIVNTIASGIAKLPEPSSAESK